MNEKSFGTELVQLIGQHTPKWCQRWRQLTPHSGRQLVPNLGTALVVVLLLWANSAGAAPWNAPVTAPAWPSTTTVNYQGRLADSGGVPVNGTVGMDFAFYDSDSGGTLLWGPESHTGLPISDGLFSVQLGSRTSGGIPTSVLTGDIWLEITVDGETLSPRERLGAVPYAMQALTVPDGAITSRNMTPTFFETKAGSEIEVTTSSKSANQVAFSLTVDFPVDANYLIFYKIVSRHGDANRRVITTLKDENFERVGLSSSIVNCHPRGGVEGTETGFATATHFFPAGTHTINVIAWADYPDSSFVRGGSSIVAIPFAVTP